MVLGRSGMPDRPEFATPGPGKILVLFNTRDQALRGRDPAKAMRPRAAAKRRERSFLVSRKEERRYVENHRAVGFHERPEELPGGAEESVVAPKSAGLGDLAGASPLRRAVFEIE